MWTTHDGTYTEDETTHGGEDGQHDGHPSYGESLAAYAESESAPGGSLEEYAHVEEGHDRVCVR